MQTARHQHRKPHQGLNDNGIVTDPSLNNRSLHQPRRVQAFTHAKNHSSLHESKRKPFFSSRKTCSEIVRRFWVILFVFMQIALILEHSLAVYTVETRKCLIINEIHYYFFTSFFTASRSGGTGVCEWEDICASVMVGWYPSYSIFLLSS